MENWYLWIKSVHVIAVIAWMAGLLYLPRLFVYHAQVAKGSAAAKLFVTMEKKLMHMITVPAATLAWVLGLIMAAQIGARDELLVLREVRPGDRDDRLHVRRRALAPRLGRRQEHQDARASTSAPTKCRPC